MGKRQEAGGSLVGFCNDLGLNLPSGSWFGKSIDIGDFAKEKPVGLDAER